MGRPDLHHRDDRADADDDAQASQDGARDVAAQRHDGAFERAEELLHDAPPAPAPAPTAAVSRASARSGVEMSPSFIQMVRRAALPTLESCVTRMIVIFSSLFRRWNISSISALVRESRFPVGSSANSSGGRLISARAI